MPGAQAICDASCRFTYVSVQTPGSAHDSLAFSLSSAYALLTIGAVSELLQRLRFYIVVDQAYAVTPTMMGPWPGDALEALKDTFNYYQSRTRCPPPPPRAAHPRTAHPHATHPPRQ
jgi:hypothetical protein